MDNSAYKSLTSSKNASGLSMKDTLDDFDSDDDEDLTEAEKVEYLSDKKNFEFKILLIVKIFFLCVIGGLLFFFDSKFDPFFDQYLENSCKFTYMSYLIVNGGEYDKKSDSDFKYFTGIGGINKTLDETDGFFENTTITSSLANINVFT
jgi:hypothetical protein